MTRRRVWLLVAGVSLAAGIQGMWIAASPDVKSAATAVVLADVVAMVVVALVLLVRWSGNERRRHEADLQRHDARWRRHLDDQLGALGSVVEQAVECLASGAQVPQDLVDRRDLSAPVEAAVELLVGGVAEVQRRLLDERQSTSVAVVALARGVQTLAHRVQDEAARMAERHPSDPDVLETSMRVDHAAAQQARQAQSLAVLCGHWPGQQWQQPLPLVEAVRAAAGRITSYQRVQVSGDRQPAVVPAVAESLIHLVSELVANAAQSSPPTAPVLVTVRTVQRGGVIEIDDGGVGLPDAELAVARETVSGRRRVGLTDLGEVPQTGLAVVGEYVRRHRLQADLMQSVYGGLRAVVLVPSRLLQDLAPEQEAVSSPPDDVASPAPADEAPDSAGEWSADESAGGLPQRHSRRHQAVRPRPGRARRETAACPDTTPEQAGAWMSAYLSRPVNDPDNPSAE